MGYYYAGITVGVASNLSYRFGLFAKNGLQHTHRYHHRSDPHGITLANEIQNHTEHGVLFDGFYDERSSDRLPSSEYPIKGAVNQALERAKRGEVDYVYIAMPMHAKERIASILNQFSDTTANTYLIPDFFTYNLLHSRWDQIGQVQTLSVFDTPLLAFHPGLNASKTFCSLALS